MTDTTNQPPTLDDYQPNDAELDQITLTGSTIGSQAAPEASQDGGDQTARTNAPPAQDASEADTEADEDEDRARNARLARELREARRKARQLELDNQALRGQRQQPVDEALEREIEARAAQRVAQQATANKSQAILADGRKAHGAAFDEALTELNESLGQGFASMADALLEVDAAPALIMHLADNPDLAEEIAQLPPARLGAALAREAAKITTPKPKPVTKAPKPIRPIATTSASDPGDVTGDAWFERENAEMIKQMYGGRY